MKVTITTIISMNIMTILIITIILITPPIMSINIKKMTTSTNTSTTTDTHTITHMKNKKPILLKLIPTVTTHTIIMAIVTLMTIIMIISMSIRKEERKEVTVVDATTVVLVGATPATTTRT
jgi:hypothetical protein